MESNEMELKDFETLLFLGNGAYGKVHQVKKLNGIDANEIYAIKAVKIKLKKIETERNILSRLKHPFVVELFYTFAKKNKFYFVLEYLSGGSLALVLNVYKHLPEETSAFYVKEITVALEYIHSEGIIYRDLKLSNIMLDAHGHIRIVDFGLSEDRFSPDSRCYYTCGTPYYKAPEIINKTGYGFAVDWWALGILFYRMVAGKYPFSGKIEDEVQAAILNGIFTLPEHISANAKDLITKLLQVNEKERLGYANGAAAVKQHQYFKNTSWYNVNQRLEPIPLEPPALSAEMIAQFIDEEISSSLNTSSVLDMTDSQSSPSSRYEPTCAKRARLDSSDTGPP